MTDWFADADPGYIAWLADHPGGFVLDTYAPPRAERLILHRADCSRVSKPLAIDWLVAPRFGKACADTPEELREWAAERTGGSPRSCGLCGGDGV
jgi:hypothetical protein